MRKHDEYQELCALAIIGQLTSEQHWELSEHLRTCISCANLAQAYVDTIHHLPVELAPLADRDVLGLQENSRAAHFFSRARTEGIKFSGDALSAFASPAEVQRPRFPLNKPFSSAIAAMLVLGLSVVLWGRWKKPEPVTVAARVNPSAPVVTRPAVPPRQDAKMAAELAAERARADEYERQLAAITGTLRKVRSDQAQASAQLSQQAQLVARYIERDAQQRMAIGKYSAEMQKLTASRDHLLADFVADEDHIHDLQSSVVRAKDTVERERQLNAAASDVRQLMGARNLHIIDVYDSEDGSRSNKSFGRVIYVQGKSLIFYAFDLDKVHSGSKVIFQAWGERDGYEKEASKLGVFYVDDAAQKRWVMKVNDPAKLKSIDTVFVTVENHMDAPFPKGHRILQAFLGSRPNHP